VRDEDGRPDRASGDGRREATSMAVYGLAVCPHRYRFSDQRLSISLASFFNWASSSSLDVARPGAAAASAASGSTRRPRLSLGDIDAANDDDDDDDDGLGGNW